jgi:putative Mg2+ transporter-C (MgtC) family protein
MILGFTQFPEPNASMDSAFESFWQSLASDFDGFLSVKQWTHLIVRISAACVVGGIVGYQRQRLHKAAGVRTHMLVAVGSAFFVAVPYLDGMSQSDISRVVQGVVTGIGFLGAGVILKPHESRTVKGLTSAACIWYVAALGIACGLGKLIIAATGAVAALVILGLIPHLSSHTTDDEDA